MTPEGLECRVLYRDALMIVIDKPAGMAVHRGPKGGASLEDGFDELRFGLPRAPALAHRLDRDTSGCLVLGRHRKALAHLGALFKHGRVGKTYWAVVEGGPDAHEGEIDLPLGRLDATRGWWMKPDAKGLPALTKWRVLGRAARSVASPLVGEAAAAGGGRGVTSNPGAKTPLPIPPPQGGREQQEAMHQKHDKDFTWLALEPVTGRTHHCACIARQKAGRSSAMRSTAVRRATAVLGCISTPPKSWFRSIPGASRSGSPPPFQGTCANCLRLAGGRKRRRVGKARRAKRANRDHRMLRRFRVAKIGMGHGRLSSITICGCNYFI